MSVKYRSFTNKYGKIFEAWCTVCSSSFRQNAEKVGGCAKARDIVYEKARKHDCAEAVRWMKYWKARNGKR